MNIYIFSESEYAYSTGVLGDVVDTTSYTYDTQWKDLLTNVDGQSISYDNIGNPTTYLGANLTWEGRNLTSYENEDKKLTFSYDENGIYDDVFPLHANSPQNAITYVRIGGNVFTSSKNAAYRLAISINGSPPVGPEKHGNTLGYFNHYRARKRIGAGNNGGHIFYI